MRASALNGEAVWLIVLKRAEFADVRGSRMEPISSHGLRAGFVTSAYRNDVPDEEIMAHSRHRSLTVMGSYVRRATLSNGSPTGKVGLKVSAQ